MTRMLNLVSLGLAVTVTLAIFASQLAQAQTFSVLHTFNGGKGGAGASSELVLDKAGNLYGTTAYGGKQLCGSFSCGTIFKVTASGQEKGLYDFTGGNDGGGPSGLLRSLNGDFYGYTGSGGDLTCRPPSGCGTIFRLDHSGNKTILHSFTASEGMSPAGNLVRDAAGNFYGVTFFGGDLTCAPPSGCGTVFKLDAGGNVTVIHSFSGSDGRSPIGGLARDSAGNLYGTTLYGGKLRCQRPNGCGTVFKIDVNGNETVLHEFAGGVDGTYPYGGVIQDPAGNLYGTTSAGGDLSCQAPSGCGTVFMVNSAGMKRVLHRFSGADGREPIAPLIRDAVGNLYGTTGQGGDLTCNAQSGCGTVFKLDTTGTESVLYAFTNGPDGSGPFQGLVLDSAGNLYGTTQFGGDLTCAHPSGCGTVFKITPQ